MQTYSVFIERVKDIHRLGALQGHLGWDQETIMPVKGAEVRGEILAWLAKERHLRITDSNLGELLTTLETESDLDADQPANVREMRRVYDKSIKLPSEFVSNYAKARSEALLGWQKARGNSDFSSFEPPHCVLCSVVLSENSVSSSWDEFVHKDAGIGKVE